MKTLLTVCLLAVSVSAWAADAPKKAGAPKKADEAIHVEKAAGENAYTVAEIVSKRAELKDQTVLVHAKVVKFNPQIMGKNWAHLRDGTGSEADGSDDILATMQEAVKVGDVVTVKAVVRVDKDFGSGYAYDVMLEEASVQK